MKKLLILILISIYSCTITLAQTLPKVNHGSIERIEAFKSKFIEDTNVDVWLPENYSSQKKYAVLYMHDGQMLFDAQTTWNKQAWEAEEVASRLLDETKVRDFIVVGIWSNGNTRHARYFPQKPFEDLSPAQKDTISKALQEKGRITTNFQPNSDAYLKFIIQELKPLIDQKYSVYKDRNNTFMAGSSMGGLISLYAICEYPEVFGGVVCLSTHWPGIFSVENNPIPDAFLAYMNTNLPKPKTHKIYFDYGDKTLDALYPPLQKKVDELMKNKGFTAKNWSTKFFPGKDHSEKSWSERLGIPLEFLLEK
jgi:predicted alpha/beta superfamily hydrolase